MKKYLLTIIANFKSEKMCQDLAISLTPLVDSPQMKFQHNKGVMIFHFATEVDKEELFDYISGILFGVTDTFILTELSDNLTVSFPKEVKEHLFDLENATGDVDMNIDMNQIKNNSEMFGEDEEEDDIVALLLDEMKDLVKRPTLDQILDKINSKGYQSLTPFEQNVLDGYSKK